MSSRRISQSMVLLKFDNAVSDSHISWTPTSPIHLTEAGFQFQCRICPQFIQKPQLSSDSGGHDDTKDEHLVDIPPSHPQSDICNPPHIYQVGSIPPCHSLVFNKYCVFRPQYLLLTDSTSRSQSEPLDETDLRAAWTCLTLLEGEHMVIYNCGKEAGSSRTHKHLQILPRPAPSTDFTVFPDRPEQVKVPYVYDILHFEQVDSVAFPECILHDYASSLRRARNLLEVPDGEEVPHNVVLVKEWMLVIPRRRAGIGVTSANAAGMLGMVWVRSREELEEWQRCGLTKCLAEFGVPVWETNE